jgi:hypothetical protein
MSLELDTARTEGQRPRLGAAASRARPVSPGDSGAEKPIELRLQ